MIVVLDAGHGGSDSGATGNGLLEKDLTLNIVLKMKQLLESYDVDVKLTRDSDEYVSLDERTNFANRHKADYLVSVHINAGGGSGYEDYIYDELSHTTNTSKLRTVMHNEIMSHLDVENRGKKKANFHMLRESQMSAILTENMFIDHEHDAQKLKSEAFLDDVAQGHVNGLVEAFDLEKLDKSHKTYTIEKGDTLSDIAYNHQTSVDAIVSLNDSITNKNRIYTGQQIKLPDDAKPQYQNIHVSYGDTLSEIAKQYDSSVSELVKINHIKDPNKIKAGQTIKIPLG